MFYNSFVVLTDTPARLANFLEARGYVKQVTDPTSGETSYVGVKPGMEWVKVPNPIMTDPGSGTPGQPGYIPPIYDDRSVFLVKFAHESLDADQEDVGDSPLSDQFEFSKFAAWVRNNSTVVTAPPNYTINGQPVGDAYKINGQNVWIVRIQPERFGIWQ